METRSIPRLAESRKDPTVFRTSGTWELLDGVYHLKSDAGLVVELHGAAEGRVICKAVEPRTHHYRDQVEGASVSRGESQPDGALTSLDGAILHQQAPSTSNPADRKSSTAA